MIKPRTQQDLVREQGYKENVDQEITEKIRFPGASDLHNRSKSEIAEVFATIMKSRPKMIGFSYVVGDPYITVRYRR